MRWYQFRWFLLTYCRPKLTVELDPLRWQIFWLCFDWMGLTIDFNIHWPWTQRLFGFWLRARISYGIQLQLPVMGLHIIWSKYDIKPSRWQWEMDNKRREENESRGSSHKAEAAGAAAHGSRGHTGMPSKKARERAKRRARAQ